MITNSFRVISQTITSRGKSLEPECSPKNPPIMITKSDSISSLQAKLELPPKSADVFKKLRSSKSTSLKPAARSKMIKKARTAFPAPKIIKLIPTKFKSIFVRNTKKALKAEVMPLIVDPNKIQDIYFRPKQIKITKTIEIICDTSKDKPISIEDVHTELLSHVEDWDELHVEKEPAENLHETKENSSFKSHSCLQTNNEKYKCDDESDDGSNDQSEVNHNVESLNPEEEEPGYQESPNDQEYH